jgi:hypothetical protein
MAVTLVGVRAKIERAKKHIDDFDAAFLSHGTIISTQVEKESVEHQPEGRRVTAAVSSGKLPPDICLPIGDAVHNVRSALDHLICQLAVAAGNSAECDRTQFPIYIQDTPDNRKTLNRRIRAVGPAAQTEIKSLQPYERRPQDPASDLLWMLSALDNIDKHRLLLVAHPQFTKLRLHITIDGEAQSVTPSDHPDWRPLKFGAEPLRFRFLVPYDNTRPETKVEVKAEPLVGVVFQQTGLKCDGSDVRQVVRDMVADVTTIVDDFERKFFR